MAQWIRIDVYRRGRIKPKKNLCSCKRYRSIDIAIDPFPLQPARTLQLTLEISAHVHMCTQAMLAHMFIAFPI